MSMHWHSSTNARQEGWLQRRKRRKGSIMVLPKRRFQFLVFVVGYMSLSFIAGKCREMVGERGTSQSGKFSIFDCLDGGSGTLVCGVKEGVKLYTNNMRTVHVEVARSKAVESTLAEALAQGMETKVAAKQAKKVGDKAAKVANRNANRILGPMVSSLWDLVEVIYCEGSVTESGLRGAGTLFGTYSIGFLGEERYGRFGYLVGSQLGSWIGGKIGIMAYDILNAMPFLLQLQE